MCSACMTISPLASNRAVEASRRSLMFAECAERTSTAPISSHAARSAPTITWSVTGIHAAQRSITTRPAAGMSAAPAGRHHERRPGQLDDRRAVHARRRRAEHLGVPPARRRSARAGCRAAAGRPRAGSRQLRARLGDRDAHGHELELGVRVGVAVALARGRASNASRSSPGRARARPSTVSSNAWPA